MTSMSIFPYKIVSTKITSVLSLVMIHNEGECNLSGEVFKDIEGLYKHMETNHTIDDALKTKEVIIKKVRKYSEEK